ncbi:class V chitinase-like [Prosopis cineraria]|uniref:class V chitinase-like n=1 Tax=Prosopis cineraria TaxID=364024 RepID=UPI00240ECE05|nr:class V chitinase-like [Prosopis cineraria]
MSRVALLILCLVCLPLIFEYAKAQSLSSSWIRVGYESNDTSVCEINTTLFTHLICGFGFWNPSSNEVYIDEIYSQCFNFSSIIKDQNPSIKTFVSIKGFGEDLHWWVTNSSFRTSFVHSSMQLARHDAFWRFPETDSDMEGMASIFQEWRDAARAEASDSNSTSDELILTAAVHYSPHSGNSSHPIESIRKNLNWIHVVAYDYTTLDSSNVTSAHSSLYNHSSRLNTDYAITQWIDIGVPSTMLVMGLACHGFAWNLKDPHNNAIGSPSTGPANINSIPLGMMPYKDIKTEIFGFFGGSTSVGYNDTYVINYYPHDFIWIAFDDVEAIKLRCLMPRQRSCVVTVCMKFPLMTIGSFPKQVRSLNSTHFSIQNPVLINIQGIYCDLQ